MESVGLRLSAGLENGFRKLLNTVYYTPKNPSLIIQAPTLGPKFRRRSK